MICTVSALPYLERPIIEDHTCSKASIDLHLWIFARLKAKLSFHRHLLIRLNNCFSLHPLHLFPGSPLLLSKPWGTATPKSLLTLNQGQPSFFMRQGSPSLLHLGPWTPRLPRSQISNPLQPHNGALLHSLRHHPLLQ
jgi:hypothetical protein